MEVAGGGTPELSQDPIFHAPRNSGRGGHGAGFSGMLRVWSGGSSVRYTPGVGKRGEPSGTAGLRGGVPDPTHSARDKLVPFPTEWRSRNASGFTPLQTMPKPRPYRRQMPWPAGSQKYEQALAACSKGGPSPGRPSQPPRSFGLAQRETAHVVPHHQRRPQAGTYARLLA